MSVSGGDGYAGDVAARAAWDALRSDPAAVLIDVRTRAEWAYVGLPTLAEIGKDVLLVDQSAPARVGDVAPDDTGNADRGELLGKQQSPDNSADERAKRDQGNKDRRVGSPICFLLRSCEHLKNLLF